VLAGYRLANLLTTIFPNNKDLDGKSDKLNKNEMNDGKLFFQ
jgi:hypothetical protein